MADGREIFARPNFRGADEPVELDLAIVGAQQLGLEVDFGDREDTMDRIIWGRARVMRK